MAQIARRRMALTAAAAAIIIVGISGCTDPGEIADIKPANLGAAEGTLTITAPLRNTGADNTYVSDSIIVTLSKSLADEGWMPMLSDGSCNVLSPGATTNWIGADGVQMTSFDQTTVKHLIITQSQDDIDCDLEYAVPEPTAKTFETTIKPGV